MKRYLLSLVSFCLSVQLYAQDPVAQKYASVITPETAKKHLSTLASDEFEGRETGTAGAEKAAQYIADEFKKLGLKAPVSGSYFQKVSLVETKVEVKSFRVNEESFENGKDFYITGASQANHPISDVHHAKEVVFIGYGNVDIKGAALRNKVVLVINKKNLTSLELLKSKQPALILAVNSDVDSTLRKYSSYFTEARLSLKTNSTEQGSASKTVAVVNIKTDVANQFFKSIKKDYETLAAELDAGNKSGLQFIKADFSFSYGVNKRAVEAKNVLGYLEGTDLKDELVVISAHYDHVGMHGEGEDKIYNGADDDGSGTTAMLEMARAYTQAKQEGKSPRRSILFLGNVGEEKGLLGSEWYSNHPVFPLAQTITNLNIDMIGRVDPAHKVDSNYCYLIGSDKLSTDLHKISENANATYTKLKIDYKYNDPADPERIYYRSDHYNFAKHNIPVIFYFNGVHEDYHKPSDEVSKINFNLLAKRAHLVFYTGWELLNRDKRPVVDVINNMGAR